MSEIELKACPFCGGEAGIRKWQDEDLWSHAIVEWQKAHCTECECEGISSCPGYDPDTVQAWNTRAPQWQPIESAPKDGSMFLCWVSAVRFGTRDDGSLAEEDCSEADFGYWMTVRDGGVFHNVQGEIGDQSSITHWQPLPAPPEVG